ncbi:ras association domain-containing protein 8 [Lampris incognitus]|uniref:ras association domain-containing protein 8 n=1 Tax=Lampris incognitus TaxID=2546036 RepID=UPI0024B5A4FA|nr:ras association domain-containing protein 8 [Lampris incognitus]
MEVKVSVDGVPRIVCGVTEKTTCQEVVIALAQALGRPGRYTLRENFKDFEQYMRPNECLLESVEKYGQQARDVELTLLHNGPSLWDEMSAAKGGRYQSLTHMRINDAKARMPTGSRSRLHRQSLPPLACLQEAEKPTEEMKRPKRKSLTLMEEAWGWLQSLGKGRHQHPACSKQSSKTFNKRYSSSMNVLGTLPDNTSAPVSLLSKIRGRKTGNFKLDHQTSHCMGSPGKEKESKQSKKNRSAGTTEALSNSSKTEETENEQKKLRETIMCQMVYLQDLQTRTTFVDEQIKELEEHLRSRKAEREGQQKVFDEIEQLQFWEMELKEEEGYEQDLQAQFLEIKEKVAECKANLKGYKSKMQMLNLSWAQNADKGKPETVPRKGSTNTVAEVTISYRALKPRSYPVRDATTDRELLPRRDLSPLLAPNLTKDQDPTESREQWAQWSEVHFSKTETKEKVMHRSELTIYLGSTKV